MSAEVPNHQIECDFTPPQIDARAYYARQVGRSLLGDLEALKVPVVREQDTLHKEKSDLELLTDMVRATVKYKHGALPWEESGQGNCWTFSWLTAELLPEFGFESRVAFCNDHVFNFAISPASGRVHMLNTDLPSLNVYDLENDALGAQLLPPATLARVRNMESDEVTRDAMNVYPLKVAYDQQLHRRNDSEGVALLVPWLDAKLPALTVMHAKQGQEAMFLQMCVEAAIERKNLPAALQALTAAQGNNLAYDGRPEYNDSLQMLPAAVRKWAFNPNNTTDQIFDVLQLFEERMKIPGYRLNKRFLQEMGDIFRMVGQIRDDVSALEQAEAYYTEAKSRRKSQYVDETLEGKISKTRQLMKLSRVSAGDLVSN